LTSKNHQKTSEKPSPNHHKINEKIILFLDIVFFTFWLQFGPLLGLKMDPKMEEKLGPAGPGSDIKTDSIF